MDDFWTIFWSIPKKAKPVKFVLGSDDEDDEEMALPPTNEWDV